MARPKKDEVNKTKLIVDYSKANPTQGPKAIVLHLKKQGVSVSPQYVSSIRSKAGVSRGKRRGAKSEEAASASTAASTAASTIASTRGRKSAATGSSLVAYPNLVEAKKFVTAMGNMAHAKQVLDALANLQ